ncbi:hypothetical protein JCM11251_006213 [Rhodosporidiobolus azoricus]
MLSAARRSLLPGAPLLPAQLDLRFAHLSLNHSSFSTSSHANEAQRVRLSKVKRAERADKLEKKRTVRGLRREREEERRERVRMKEHRRVEEAREKRVVGEDIADSLSPFSEDQLQSMYEGLLLSSPNELSAPLLAAPQSAPALPDPAHDSLERTGRLTLLEQRLMEIEGELEDLVEKGGKGESLAERLKARRSSGEGEEKVEEAQQAGAEGQASVPAVSHGAARALIDRLEALLPEEVLKEPPALPQEGSALSLPRGLLSRSEWEDLVLACAEEGDREGVFKALQLMDRSTPISEGKVLEDTLALYSATGRTQDALALASFARQHSLPLSVLAHHHLLTSLAPSHPELALQHLRSMEAAGHTPLLATYTAVIHRLLSPLSPPHLVRSGWDLFAHTRAVAYPVPDTSLFSTMIRACASGAHPAPDRAIDLFTEMTEDNRLPATEAAFNGVIRACSREGSQEYYYEALRYMRRMLDENVEPSRHTFHALLEGAKRHGDLARARWMLVKMVTVGGEAAPTEKTLSLVLQTYAAFRPESRVRNEAGAPATERVAPEQGHDAEEFGGGTEERPFAVLEPSQDPTNLASSPPLASSSSSTQAVIQLLGEASIFYPGPMPTTSAEVVSEARNLMLQVVDASVLSPSATSPDSANSSPSRPLTPQASMFPDVEPSTFLFNSYLTVLNSHAPLPSSLSFFSHAYAALSPPLPKNRFSYELIMRRLELAKNAHGAVGEAKKVFEEWLVWRDQKFTPDCVGAKGEVGEDGLDKKELERWIRDRKDGRNASRMWGGLIRILSRNFLEDEALAVLKRFVELHPPSTVAAGISLPSLAPAPATPTTSNSSPLPVLPIKFSSHLYPETAPPLDSLRSPFLLFDDLRLLHLRLANMENKQGVDYVKWVAKRYEQALRKARKRETRREDK